MTISLALSYSAFYGRSFEAAIEAAHDFGFESVQLIPDQSPNLCEELTGARRTYIRRLADQRHMTLSVHNVFYDINPVSVVPAVMRAALDISHDVFTFAQDIGATSVVVHPGYCFPGWRRDDTQRKRFEEAARNGLRAMCADAKELGIRVLFENGSYCLTTPDRMAPVPLHLGITPKELRWVLDLVEFRAGVCLDVNKALRSGAPLEEFLAAVAGHIGQVQVSTVHQYWSLIGPFLRALCDTGFDGTIVLEGSPTETIEGVELIRGVIASF